MLQENTLKKLALLTSRQIPDLINQIKHTHEKYDFSWRKCLYYRYYGYKVGQLQDSRFVKSDPENSKYNLIIFLSDSNSENKDIEKVKDYFVKLKKDQHIQHSVKTPWSNSSDLKSETSQAVMTAPEYKSYRSLVDMPDISVVCYLTGYSQFAVKLAPPYKVIAGEDNTGIITELKSDELTDYINDSAKKIYKQLSRILNQDNMINYIDLIINQKTFTKDSMLEPVSNSGMIMSVMSDIYTKQYIQMQDKSVIWMAHSIDSGEIAVANNLMAMPKPNWWIDPANISVLNSGSTGNADSMLDQLLND